MAYENYRFISWTDGTPVSSDRLHQMSTNIEQVKDATDNRPQGLIQIHQITTDTPSSVGYSDFVEYELIALKLDAPNDRRVNIDGNRYYKMNLSFPGFVIKGRGAEDSTFVIKFYQGIFGSASSLLATWEITPPIFSYYDVSSDPSTTTVSVKQNGYPTVIGGGMYSTVLSSSSSGVSSESFYATIKRDQGDSTTNAPAYYVPGTLSAIQLYIEDIGGI
jgi:hypothetical protein